MKYSELNVGDVFTIGSDPVTLYTKTELYNTGCSCSKHNAKNLLNGTMVFFKPDQQVIKKED
jgi:hypothetical protein